MTDTPLQIAAAEVDNSVEDILVGEEQEGNTLVPLLADKIVGKIDKVGQAVADKSGKSATGEGWDISLAVEAEGTIGRSNCCCCWRCSGMVGMALVFGPLVARSLRIGWKNLAPEAFGSRLLPPKSPVCLAC